MEFGVTVHSQVHRTIKRRLGDCLPHITPITKLTTRLYGRKVNADKQSQQTAQALAFPAGGMTSKEATPEVASHNAAASEGGAACLVLLLSQIYVSLDNVTLCKVILVVRHYQSSRPVNFSEFAHSQC